MSWGEAVAGQDALRDGAAQEGDKPPRGGSVGRAGDDSGRVDDGRVIAPRRSLFHDAHAPRLDPGIRREHDARLGVTARDVGQRLPNVLAEHSLGLNGVPQAAPGQRLTGVPAGRYGVGIGDRNSPDEGRI